MLTNDENKKAWEDIVEKCKKLLTENGLKIKTDWLPYIDFDNTYDDPKNAIKNWGIFEPSHDGARVYFDFAKIFCFGDIEIWDFAKKYREKINAEYTLRHHAYGEKLENCKCTTAFCKNCPRVKDCNEYGALHGNYVLAFSNERWVRLLCDTLKNLEPNLPNYYERIIWLIDNGAYIRDVTKGESNQNVFKNNFTFRQLSREFAQIPDGALDFEKEQQGYTATDADIFMTRFVYRTAKELTRNDFKSPKNKV